MCIRDSDRVKYDLFYRSGFEHKFLLQSVATLGQKRLFLSASYEGKQFWKLKEKTNLAIQLRAAIGSDDGSPFAPFVLDSNFNLRGVGNRVDRATAQIVLNIELRQTLWTYKNIAIQGVAFSDTGSWRNPGQDFSTLFEVSSFRTFVGVGGRVILTKVFDAVLRVDFGLDVFDGTTNGLVIGFGQFF